MRKQLQGLTEKDYWVYGIQDTDFDYTLTLIKDMLDARKEQYLEEETRIRKSNSDSEILSDISYYKYIGNQYLWQFALWRLQGLIEAVISYQLLEIRGSEKLFGLKSKLLALKENGYSIKKEEVDELMLWANLRNAISHAPPEQYNPTSLGEEDIIEYSNFLKTLYLRWKKEKINKNNKICDI